MWMFPRQEVDSVQLEKLSRAVTAVTQAVAAPPAHARWDRASLQSAPEPRWGACAGARPRPSAGALV